jgi:hypothetical protein
LFGNFQAWARKGDSPIRRKAEQILRVALRVAVFLNQNHSKEGTLHIIFMNLCHLGGEDGEDGSPR